MCILKLMGTAHRNKHSSFSTTFPIYLFTQRTDLVPDEEAEAEASTEEKKPQTEADDASADEEEAVVEDVTDKDEETTKEAYAVIEANWPLDDMNEEELEEYK